MKRFVRAGVLTALIVAGLTSCEDGSTVNRPDEPVVMTGEQLPTLLGVPPGQIVAFKLYWGSGNAVWTQVPVQVDQRKVVDYGSAPGSNTTAGVTGTVYGTAAIGTTALQYADPNTFVGADNDPSFDSNDELVFMASDAGGRPRPDNMTDPTGVVAGTGVAVQVDEPLDTAVHGWVYLFRSQGSRLPGAGQNYVTYTFTLGSGAYKTTYKRASGPNPETSKVVTPSYQIEFTDRWYEDSWKVTTGGATGVDILDGNKNQFAVDYCGRSNLTFATGEGAFIANIDGPVRAIRSYVGANSGPLTERTHVMYRSSEEIRTDLRVHPIPSVMDFLDYSAAAKTMTYLSSTTPGGVPIDGVNDAVPTVPPTWEAVTGPQGTAYTSLDMVTDISPTPSLSWFYRDQTTPPEAQCWGDASFYGASGSSSGSLPNTDPRSSPAAIVHSDRHVLFAGPQTKAAAAATAGVWRTQLSNPLTVQVTPYPPGP
ncbi:MAG: hypothetical protein JWM05_1567 [Acidimicrobiales bacterium]|nr:hypothetical protein [Acidimicrobiales bacterium]